MNMPSTGGLSPGWLHSVYWNSNVCEAALVLLKFQMWKKRKKNKKQAREWGLATSKLADGVVHNETTVFGFALGLY